MPIWALFLLIICGVLFLVTAVLVLLSYVLCNSVIRPPLRSLETALSYHTIYQGLSPDYYGSLTRIPWRITSTSGHQLVGEWILQDGNPPIRQTDLVFLADDTPGSSDVCNETRPMDIVIMLHGHGHNRMGALKFLPMFLRRGFMVLLYDQVYSGKSAGRFTTLGFEEAQDLRQIIDQIFMERGSNARIGLLGESMGAATVLIEAATDPRLRFVIADCPFADLSDQLAHHLSFTYRLPRFPFIPISSVIAHRRAGFHWSDVSPRNALRQAGGLPEISVLFVHGQSDTYIPPKSSQELFEIKQGYKDLLLVNEARHTESMVKDPNGYEQAVVRLLHHCGLTQQPDA